MSLFGQSISLVLTTKRKTNKTDTPKFKKKHKTNKLALGNKKVHLKTCKIL